MANVLVAQLCFHHQGIVTLSATSISSTITNINSTCMETRMSMEMGVLTAQPPNVVVLIVLLMDRVPWNIQPYG